jgi:hypothetical protein
LFFNFFETFPSLKKQHTHNNHFYTQLLKRSKSHHVPRIRRVRATVFDHQGTNYNHLSFRNSFSFSFARFYSLPSGAFAAAERISSRRSENKHLVSRFSLYYLTGTKLQTKTPGDRGAKSEHPRREERGEDAEIKSRTKGMIRFLLIKARG